MKALVVFALVGFSAMTLADEARPTEAEQIAVEQYHYGMRLDIAKVISSTSIPDVCNVVPAHMTYEDSNGQRHVLQYQVMGNGCSGG
jgi:hypothetical protein